MGSAPVASARSHRHPCARSPVSFRTSDPRIRAPGLALPGPQPGASGRRGGRFPGSHGPGLRQASRRALPAGAREPPGGRAPRRRCPAPARAAGTRPSGCPPTWLSLTQKTRPPRLRHTLASRGRAAAPQKVKEQREARSRCTVMRTSAAGRRPQRAHRYK